MNLYGLPTYWDDGIVWTPDTKPTARHFQAIFLAIGERQFAKDQLSEGGYWNYWGGSLLNWKACAYSAKDITNLNRLVSALYDFFDLDEAEYEAGCFGKGRLEFDLTAEGSARRRWYDDTDEETSNSFYHKLISNYNTKRIDVYAGLIDYRNIVKTMLNKCPLVMKCDKMSEANRKIMAWLIDFKNALNELHTIFVPCSLGYPVDVDGVTDTYSEEYYYEESESEGVTNSGTWTTGREQQMSNNLYVIDGGISNYKYEGWTDKHYWARVRVPPISIQNQLPFSYKASLHISGSCYQDNSFADDEYFAIEPIGDYIKKVGWNDLGTLNPNDEVQILDSSVCYNGQDVRRYWNKYGSRDNCDIRFRVQIDVIRLDFRVAGGFKFI